MKLMLLLFIIMFFGNFFRRNIKPSVDIIYFLNTFEHPFPLTLT